jgi:hypothetical protein
MCIRPKGECEIPQTSFREKSIQIINKMKPDYSLKPDVVNEGLQRP